MSISLIVGLGNPGSRYADTRHNVGARFVQALSQHYGQPLKLDTKHKGLIAQVTENDRLIRLYIPNAYMNECGRSIRALVHFYKMPVSSLLVAHDELDFKPGVIKLKDGGGHAGHNGLRDIIRHLGSRDFWRLRFGIGHPGHKDKVTDYVLGKPSLDDNIMIDRAIDETIGQIKALL